MIDLFNVILIIFIISVFIFVIGISIASTAHNDFDRICEEYKNEPNSLNMNGFQFLMYSLRILNQKTQVFFNRDNDAGDAYFPSSDRIILNKKTFFGTSIVDLAIASHEMGHSIQKHKATFNLFITTILQKINSLLGGLFIPLLLIGGIVYFIPSEYSYVGKIFIIIGFISFIVGLLLKIFLIPLEYDASRRAQKFIKKHIDIDKREYRIIKKIHKRALLTYVASLFEKPYLIFRRIFRN